MPLARLDAAAQPRGTKTARRRYADSPRAGPESSTPFLPLDRVRCPRVTARVPVLSPSKDGDRRYDPFMADDPAPQRPIRSYVLRQGRVSNAQRRAHDTLLPVYGVPYAPRRLDLGALFGRSAPRILEIGFGMGETTADIAAAHPQIDYLALEVHTPGVGSLLKSIRDRDLTNVRIIQHDAVDVLEHMLAPDT